MKLTTKQVSYICPEADELTLASCAVLCNSTEATSESFDAEQPFEF